MSRARALDAYRRSLKRAGPDEYRSYRAFMEEERRTTTLIFSDKLFELIDDLIGSIDMESFLEIQTHPMETDVIIQVLRNRLDTPFHCHYWFEKAISKYNLWRLTLEDTA
jgi:hypothetical protein